ncbi:MAG: hypothetical protein GY841_15090 [FCB group bacterium]|nr:hypothetical protein [FCB group bacterium]
MKRYQHHLILSALALAILGPLLYYRAPYFLATPDIMYVEAKVLQVLLGNLYADPVTGIATFHPPYYHLFLAPFKALGMNLHTVLVLVTISNVCLIIFFTYKTLKTAFNRQTALYTCMLLPFIIEFMGSRNILLATSFYFSTPLYLAGLWNYLKPTDSSRPTVLAAALWGAAFLISPVYLFLIGLTFVYELIIKRDFRRFGLMGGVFALTLVPFFIQAAYLYLNDLTGATTFVLWRGPLTLNWIKEVLIEFVSPTLNDPISTGAIIHLILLAAAAGVAVQSKKVMFFIPLAALAYFLTFYHFSAQYAIRIHLFLSIFIVAGLIDRLLREKINRYFLLAPILAIMLFGLYSHYNLTINYFDRESIDRQKYIGNGEKLWRVMHNYLDEGEYILAAKQVYSQYIVTRIAVHSLGAYKDMRYFQLPPIIAYNLEEDYRLVMAATDYPMVKAITDKYKIDTAVFHARDKGRPLFAVIRDNWNAVYMDEAFIIFQKPE